jgi:hypothetical protein
MTPVEILNQEYKTIVNYLNEQSQPSLASDVDKYFKKLFALSSASYFEHLIQEILIDFISKETNNNLKVISFFKKKAIGMQYHTYFVFGEKGNLDKPGNNANTFFSLFGEEFKKDVEAEINADINLKSAVKAFLEIGHIRNLLVHSNFAAYNLDNKTADEIFDLYKKGFQFVDYIRAKLQQST